MELLVALLLLSVVALAVTTALIASQRASASDARLMRAALIAADALERWRAHVPLPVADADPDFRCTLTTAAAAVAGVQRADVTVRWADHGERTLRLSSLMLLPEPEAP